MRQHIFWALIILLLSFGLQARASDNGRYNVSLIPAELLENTDAVIRIDQRRFTTSGPGEGRLEVRRVVTILNPEGRDFSTVVIPYEPFREVDDISGALYDADGERIKKLRGRDVRDEPAVSGFSLAQDSRLKIVELTHPSYPYTIEIEYTQEYDSFINFPRWSPATHRASLQESRYEVIVPRDTEIAYASRNLTDDVQEPEITNQGSEISYLWTMNNVQRPFTEPLAPSWRERMPQLVVSAQEFEFEGFRGTLDSWEDFGRWFHGLWDGRASLSEPMKERVQEMTEGLETDRQKVEVLYEYLQGNTRYVSIQLGIGGFQTETASATAENRYGDCKALTNYLLAMLDEIGIEAYPALILSGRPGMDIISEIPNQGFNHVILFVPLESGDLWLESTSSAYPAGYIGLGNAGKHTLLFSEEGGKLIRTPGLDHEDNIQHRHGTIRLNASGDATAEVRTLYGGAQKEPLLYRLFTATEREQRRYLSGQISIPRFDLAAYTFGMLEDSGAVALDLELSLPSVGNRAGSRLFIKPNLMQVHSYQLTNVAGRTLPARLGYPYYDKDTLVWQVPEHFEAEAIPDPVALDIGFASYRSEVSFDAESRELRYEREVIIRKSLIEPDEYNDLQGFYNGISRADNAQVVLVERK
jgi:transglutaminase-like putative cysteine protease